MSAWYYWKWNMFFDVDVLFLRRTLSCSLYDEMFYMNKVFYFLKYYCYDLAFNKSSYERSPKNVAVNSGLVWCIFGCKTTLTPCPSTFDPQSPICLMSVSAPYCPQARYTTLTLAHFSMAQLVKHERKHSHATGTWTKANTTIPPNSHLTTMMTVYEQNDLTATKSLKWQSRCLCCCPLNCNHV